MSKKTPDGFVEFYDLGLGDQAVGDGDPLAFVLTYWQRAQSAKTGVKAVPWLKAEIRTRKYNCTCSKIFKIMPSHKPQ